VQASNIQLSTGGHDHHFDRGSAWVVDHIILMCKRMGVAIEAREMELHAFLASLEANKKKGSDVGNQFDVEDVEEMVGKRRGRECNLMVGHYQDYFLECKGT